LTKTLNEGREHLGYFLRFDRQSLIVRQWEVFQIAREEQMIVQLVGRPERDTEEPRQFRITIAAASFRDVRRN